MLEHTMTRIDGTPEPLENYRGKVLMVVNVASKCGLTPQYEALQQLYTKYQGQGFEILGFPANNFMGQEPGTDEEIAEFCSLTYDVNFPMFSKICVAGDDMHPIYKELTSMPEPIGGDVKWNFQKYLVDREGTVVKRIEPMTKPDDPEVVGAIEELL